ncbi:hypothetical protein RRF57_001622 [Xylaria bambusicola]|uniref:Uncharacterized protein n=1 Tax=Xylaria bambusicola TaxID=326684 RepID=A0AAN7UHI6_9PEZI
MYLLDLKLKLCTVFVFIDRTEQQIDLGDDDLVGLLVLGLAPALSAPVCDGWGEWVKPVCKPWAGTGEKVPDREWEEGGGTMRVVVTGSVGEEGGREMRDRTK